mmetsp:Transcript_9600/g.39181  ORF Transcript_9600/g.39181 Transcript_9600/m.39181 type:complete len:351 (+) Transcript_9600:315-1367(+)
MSSYATSTHDLVADPWPGRDGRFVPTREDVRGVARGALRRIAAIVRIWPQGPAHLEPAHADLSAAPLRAELDAFYARERAVAPAVAVSDPSTATLLRGAGLGRYSSLVSERFPDWRTRTDATDLPAVVVASDGCERLGIGGAGAVVLDTTPGARRLYRFCARLDPGPGTMSSYRAETVGALLPMIACWTLRHVLPPGPVVAVADNAATVSGVAALPTRSSSSRDVWAEVDFWHRRVTEHFGSYAVEWQRGHPERRKPRSSRSANAVITLRTVLLISAAADSVLPIRVARLSTRRVCTCYTLGAASSTGRVLLSSPPLLAPIGSRTRPRARPPLSTWTNSPRSPPLLVAIA